MRFDSTPAEPRRPAFTLAELLVVVLVVGVLAALLVPALSRSQSAARRVRCVSNLHQLGLAGQLYWDEHAGRTFRYRGAPTNEGDLYWFGWLQRGAEGRRDFDRSFGALHPYLGSGGVTLCPALHPALKDFKRKAIGAAYGYGYNLHLSAPADEPPRNTEHLPRPSGTVFLADAAQVNTFQAPASPEHPLLEEFYYVNRTEPTAHFRHSQLANVVFVDGHVGAELWLEGSLDLRLPQHSVAQLRPEILE
jgi:prepilin-type processing-associated H-X9-DG protein/prepilin-type N-terminal cleavage/methylation domain-containing protein